MTWKDGKEPNLTQKFNPCQKRIRKLNRKKVLLTQNPGNDRMEHMGSPASLLPMASVDTMDQKQVAVAGSLGI